MAIADHIKKDSPTNTFATLNPLFNGYGTSAFSNGNLYVAGDSSNWTDSVANFYVSSGKWYWEILPYDQYIAPGIADIAFVSSSAGHTGSNQITLYGSTGSYGGDVSGSAASFDSTNIIGFLLDMDSATRTLKYYKDNSLIGTVNLPTGYTQVAPIMHLSGSATAYTKFNFGAESSFGGAKGGAANATDANGIGDFYYDPTAIDSGAKALCTANLPDFTTNVADDNSEDYFKAMTYVGDGTDTKEVTVGFVPDLCWFKDRDSTNYHTLIDSLRGGDRHLYSHRTDADRLAGDGTDGVLDFNSGNTNDKIKIGFHSGWGFVNAGSVNYIGWFWKAGGAPSGSNIYMKDGTGYTNSTSDKATVFGSASNYNITPTSASIGTKQGFGIYTFTASTGNTKLPHGLGKAPEFVIIKSTDTSSTNWVATFPAFAHDLYLNSTGVRINGSSAGTYFQTTADADVITFGLQNTTYSNKPSLEYVVYAFASIPGYSAFGSYEGNVSADGPFIYTGFKPAWFMVKNIDDGTASSGPSWDIYDNAREPNNDNEFFSLSANSGASEGHRPLDFLSNGIKIREPSSWNLNAANTYIYIAFAEQPFKFANAR